jgi:hypothetical protein
MTGRPPFLCQTGLRGPVKSSIAELLPGVRDEETNRHYRCGALKVVRSGE